MPGVEELLERGRGLDGLYVPSRYPDGLPAGAPADHFARGDADKAIRDAEAIVAFCRGALPG